MRLAGGLRVAVVGHVEWVEFARVERLPRAGEIVHALEDWDEPAGGGAVAAVQLARLAGECLFITALGDDPLGERVKQVLEDGGVTVEAARRPEPTRRAFVHLDQSGERTITVVGPRLGPRRRDSLPWGELDRADAVYFTAGDEETARAARAARTLVASVRAIDILARAHVQVDVLVSSSTDPGERYEPGDVDPPPRFVARTAGAHGGSVEGEDGSRHEWRAEPLPGPVVDSYGAGDSFAAGLTYGLAAGCSLEKALELGSRAGAACVTGRGPYGAQLG